MDAARDRDRTADDGDEEPRRDLADTPDVGLIADEDLPDDLRPSSDNPLAGDEAGEHEDDGNEERDPNG